MNSFTRAAQALGISRATATRTVQEPKRRSACCCWCAPRARGRRPKATRTTGAVRITADVDELEASIRGAALRPSGPLRVELPAAVADAIVLPALGAFHARHPDLVLTLGYPRAADRVGDAIDCSVRLGELPDSSLVARRLGTLERVTCAVSRISIAMACRVRSKTRASRGQHVVRSGPAHGRTRFRRRWGGAQGADGRDRQRGRRACVSGVRHGLGLIQPPRVAAQPLIDAGGWEVLPRWRPDAIAVSASREAAACVARRARVRRLDRRAFRGGGERPCGPDHRTVWADGGRRGQG